MGDSFEEYGGPYCKTRVRIGVPRGETAERTLRGRPYEGGMFLFDPQRPKHNVGMFELPVPVRPDAAGRWPGRVPVAYLVYALVGFAACAALAGALLHIVLRR